VRISTKGRYSLEALLFIALQPAGTFVSTKTINENTGISEGYLEQLFILMRKSGLVTSIRGPQGGYLPGKPLPEIGVGDILRSVEGSLSPVDCIDPTVCPAAKDCISRNTWTDLYAAIVSCVESISLQDLVDAYYALDQMDYTV
jgi:Rrf2 family protein